VQQFDIKRQTIGSLNRWDCVYLNTDSCLVVYYHDCEFLQANSERDPAARVCTKECDPVYRVLLCFHAVCLYSSGSTGTTLFRAQCGRILLNTTENCTSSSQKPSIEKQHF
jgi:hypothetical protein